MNELEDYILGQLLFYEQTRALLPRIKHQWFEQPLHREVIQRMSVAYYGNEAIDYMSLTKGMNNDDRMRVIFIGQNVSNVANVSSYIPKLEAKYLHNQYALLL